MPLPHTVKMRHQFTLQNYASSRNVPIKRLLHLQYFQKIYRICIKKFFIFKERRNICKQLNMFFPYSVHIQNTATDTGSFSGLPKSIGFSNVYQKAVPTLLALYLWTRMRHSKGPGANTMYGFMSRTTSISIASVYVGSVKTSIDHELPPWRITSSHNFNRIMKRYIIL